MIDSRPLLQRYGKSEEIELPEASPEYSDKCAKDVSPRFPENFKLYDHQLEAVEALKAGSNVILCAGTSSGKTEAVLLGIVDSIRPGVPCQALYVYPTKALTADQMGRFKKYLPHYGLNTCIYDGDNLIQRDREIAGSEFVMTNPEMLLRQLKNPKSKIVSMLKNVRFLVLDEVHIYTAYQVNLLMAMVNVILQCVCSGFKMAILSATIGNPSELANLVAEISGNHTEVVTGRANHPKSRLSFLSKITKFRGEYLPENMVAIEIGRKYAHDDASTIIFNDTVKDAGMIGQKIRNAVGERVEIHYGTLAKDIRENAEKGFRSGQISVMVTVKTLQQGIDIGTVQRIVHVGLPERQSDFWQRQGRMGRRKHIRLCEAIVIPSPKSPFDTFVCSDPSRFREYLGRKIERVIVKPNNKIARMFVGCMKLLYGRPVDESEINFLKTLKLVDLSLSLATFVSRTVNSYAAELSAVGNSFLQDLRFYYGESPTVRQRSGNEVRNLRVYSIFSVQPNCILFNNDLRHPEFYLVDDFDSSDNTATVIPVSEAFPEEDVNKIEEWQRFSLTKVDFSLTNPDSTFGNIILTPSAVYHIESQRSTRGKNLKIVGTYHKVAGKDEFPSNYVRADLPSSRLMGDVPPTLYDETIAEMILDGAFSCIRNGLRERFDIGYNEFSHEVTIGRDPNGKIRAEFIFYETSCSDLIPDLNWVEVKQSARSFLNFVRKINDARFFYLRGNSLYFAQINDLSKERKKFVYEWIERTVDLIIETMTEKLALTSRIREDSATCRMAKDQHSYADVCAKMIQEIFTIFPEIKPVGQKLSVFLVDNYLESGHPLQKFTIGASRVGILEGRYVMWLSIPALRKLSENGIMTLILHEFRHLLHLENRNVFESPQEEEFEIHESIRKETRMGNDLRKGEDELNDMLSSLENVQGKYSENEMMTSAGKVIENLRWQGSRTIGFVHVFRNAGEFGYHALKRDSH